MAAQNPMPPAELGGLTYTNAEPIRVHVAQAGDSAQLLVRIQQLEEQLRSQNGQIEGLTFQLTQMQEILNRMQEDNEFRFQALEGGAGGKTDAATQPGGVTQPEALPQDQTARPEIAPMTEIPEQGVQPLPGEIEFDPTYDDGSAPMDDVGNSSDPLVGTGATGGVDLTTGQPLNLSYDPAASAEGRGDEDAQFTAGYEAMASGDYEFAEEQFGQFLDLYPDSPRAADAANFLGDALLQRQAYNEAADVLLEAYQKDPQGARAAELLVKLGASMSGAGERDVACRTFAQVDASYPSLAEDVAGRLAAEKTRAQCPPA
ncbi:MAG: tetratricopeptide repeat protein [Candidatus Devosia phytovorans]|uniref:Tetratricopeptide repeat protein n=1 Tax=Candidatus Devosia phytovorans TaxID=3121372 RepID=A0AAJ6AZT1_9HYPH|nr:tetratricopeptide repeat protein [Devosia sp.]WEK04910.1 MAG: tetratricopeptide repeat protein [Devosia sp.]